MVYSRNPNTDLKRGEMHDCFNFGILCEDVAKSLLVADVDIVEMGTTATECLNTVEWDGAGVMKVIDDDDVIVVFEECEGSERANVACAAEISLTLVWTVY